MYDPSMEKCGLACERARITFSADDMGINRFLQMLSNDTTNNLLLLLSLLL